jgi:vacuolar-type H+-ATPase subunit H
MSSLRTLIGAHLAAHAEAKLQEVYTETLDHAVYLRSAADVEFHEILDEKKLDVTMTKDDGIAELDHVIDDKLDEFKQRAAEIADEVGEHAEKAYADVCERLDELIERETACLRRHKEVLKWGPRILKEEMPSTECNLTRSRGRRAISLPF